MEFPTIKNPSYPLTEIRRDMAVRGTMENITVIARKRVTRVPRMFTLNWTMLSTGDYEKLKIFYDNVNGALPFYWTHPQTNERIRVRFNGDLEFQYVEYGYWTGSLKLEEV